MSVISRNKFILFLLLFSLALLFTGCQQTNPVNDTSEAPLTDPVDIDQNDDTSSNSKDHDVNIDSTIDRTDQNELDEREETDQSSIDNEPDEQAVDDQPIDDPEPTSPDQDKESDVTQLDDDQNREEERVTTKPVETPDKPSHLDTYHLMNVHLNEHSAVVTSRLGHPIGQFPMQSDTEQWTVYEYDGFIIGFNVKDRVEFIEVYSESVQTLLADNVLVGSSVDDVVQALGEPYTQSDYVLNYRIENTTLKFDLDPYDQTIISIKLFTDR